MASISRIEEFAESLRALKERSGRSYGALAGRLHVSTSTLHRYCNGDAVPTDYAPVERLARLCGATPDELVALHRRWILADAARQAASSRGGTVGKAPSSGGGGEPTATKGTTADTEAAPGSSADSDADTGGDAKAAAPGAGLDNDPDGIQHPAEAEAAGARVASTDPVPGLIRRLWPWPDRPSPAAPLAPLPAASLARPASSTAPASPPSRSAATRCTRPWTLAIGAAAAVILAVTAAAVRPPESGERHPAAGGPPTSGPRSSAGPSSDPNRQLKKDKHGAKAPSGSPRAREPHHSGSPSPTPGGDQGAAEQGAPDSASGTPLTLATRSHVWENRCDHRYLVDRPPAEVAPPPAEQDAPGWAAAHGAVHGGTTNVEMTVQGRSSAAVVLQDLHVRVVGRRTPLLWSSFAMENGCGGSLTPRLFSVNLDAARPLARPTDGNDAGKPIPAVRFPYRVSDTDPEVLLVKATTSGCDCSWYLELDWTSDGRKGTVRIDDNGKPFRTSSVKGRPEYGYYRDQGGWIMND